MSKSRGLSPVFVVLMLICAATALVLVKSCFDTPAHGADVTVSLLWTASGDDGMTGGPCSAYDLRYTADTSAEWSDWLSISTGVPGVPGSTDSVQAVLSVETGRTYFFAIKAADETPNWSERSNIVGLYLADQFPPSPVVDLRGEWR